MHQFSKELYDKILVNPLAFIIVNPDGQVVANIKSLPNSSKILSGSFNPLHDGHRNIWKHMGENTIDNPKYYEISITNVDKPNIGYEDILKRVKQFQWYAPVIITNAPKFVDKVKALGTDHHFIAGIDTALRIIRDHSTEFIESLRAEFYIGGRILDGQKQTLDTLRPLGTIPSNFHDFDVSEEFMHLSSSHLRNNEK